MKNFLLVVGALASCVLFIHPARAEIAHGYSNLFAIEAVSATPIQEVPSGQAQLISSFPNPFNPRTSLKFSLAQAASVEIAIYDLQGRQVRLLTRDSFSAGTHETSWDGMDSRNRPAPGGTYFCRLVSRGEIHTLKLALTK